MKSIDIEVKDIDGDTGRIYLWVNENNSTGSLSWFDNGYAITDLTKKTDVNGLDYKLIFSSFTVKASMTVQCTEGNSAITLKNAGYDTVLLASKSECQSMVNFINELDLKARSGIASGIEPETTPMDQSALEDALNPKLFKVSVYFAAAWQMTVESDLVHIKDLYVNGQIVPLDNIEYHENANFVLLGRYNYGTELAVAWAVQGSPYFSWKIPAVTAVKHRNKTIRFDRKTLEPEEYWTGFNVFKLER